MKILFIHQNFPGQFQSLAPALVRAGHQVMAMTLQKVDPHVWNGVVIVPYTANRGSTPNIHPWVTDIETKTIRAEACFRAALQMKAQGYVPDAIIAHPGWGESLYLKEVWPQARLGIYCEYFYHRHGADLDFDPEFPVVDEGEVCRLHLKNLNYQMHLEIADAGLCPTAWQAGTFPAKFQEKITVVHDGIDTHVVRPNPDVQMRLDGLTTLTRNDEVITFVNRNLEPLRGYHIFMRALPEVLRRRPEARVLIVGGDEVSYGVAPGNGVTWKMRYANEVRAMLPTTDWERVYFLGRIEYRHFLALLQLSSVHVYLTYPFVLSWSLLEAMSAGCAIVASDTAPVREVVEHDITGRLVNFFDVSALADTICQLLEDPQARARLGSQARKFAQGHYDLEAVCLPQQLAWFDRWARTDAK